MRFNPKEIACALDIGQSAVKLVLFRKNEVLHNKFDLQQEGILDRDELFGENGIIKWLKEQHLEKLPQSVIIPQYLCTTKVLNDFPKNAKDDVLEVLITNETRNLAGLSDEIFVSDFQKMTPVYSAENPILVGFCRQQVPLQSQEDLERAGLVMNNAIMGSSAVVNTLLSVHPELNVSREPQVILDIGVETTTCVVLLSGNILSTTSLMAGTASCQNNKYQLINELSTALDNWKTSELPDIAEHYVDAIWLCGGGALTPGLADELKQQCNCNAKVFGPSFDGKTISPEYAAAYGAALQEIGKGRYTLSMAPESVCWRRTREDRFKTLATACALFFILLFASLYAYNYKLNSESEYMHENIERLRKCDNIIPKLDKALDELEYQQLILTPIVETGSRSNIFMRSLEIVSSSLAEKDWCIYFTDQFSHKDYGTKDEKAEKETKQQQEKRNRPSSLFSAEESMNDTPEQETNLRVNLNQLPQLERIIIEGYTAVPGNQRYEAILKIQNQLNASQLFTNVDWLDEKKDATGREVQVAQGWGAYLKNNKNYFYDEFTGFKLKLQLRQNTITMPEKE